MKTVKMGDGRDFGNLINAVIDEKSFDNIAGYIDRAKKSPDAEIVLGGGYSKKVGYFVEPPRRTEASSAKPKRATSGSTPNVPPPISSTSSG